MKKLLLVLISLPVMAFSQKIKKSEVDKFTKQKRIETSSELIRSGFTDVVAVSLRAVDTTCFINLLVTNWSIGVIGSDSPIMFLLDNGETVTAMSTGIQSYKISNASTKSFDHQYKISKEGLEKLAAHKLKSIRRYTTENYSDLDIKERMQDRLKDLSAVFLEELNK